MVLVNNKDILTDNDKKYLTSCVATILLELKCSKSGTPTINATPEVINQSFAQAKTCIDTFMKFKV